MTAAIGRRKRRKLKSEINVVPYIDVMLVLLIIFMVTAPLLTAGVPVQLPDSRATALDVAAKPLQVSIDDGGRIFVDDKPVDEAALPDALAQIVARAPQGKPPETYLRADKSLPYGDVMRVMGELNRAGLNRVSLLTVEGGEQK